MATILEFRPRSSRASGVRDGNPDGGDQAGACQRNAGSGRCKERGGSAPAGDAAIILFTGVRYSWGEEHQHAGAHLVEAGDGASV